MGWSFYRSSRLSRTGKASIEDADRVLISPISFYEIAQKVRLSKWPEMTPFVEDLLRMSTRQGAGIAGLAPEICLLAGRMEWSHRDPFDRFLAATALHLAVPIVSADPVFDGVISRVW